MDRRLKHHQPLKQNLNQT